MIQNLDKLEKMGFCIGRVETHTADGANWHAVGVAPFEAVTSLEALIDLIAANHDLVAAQSCRFTVLELTTQTPRGMWVTRPIRGWDYPYFPVLEQLPNGDVYELWPAKGVFEESVFVPIRDGAVSDLVEMRYVPPVQALLGPEKHKIQSGGFFMARTHTTVAQWAFGEGRPMTEEEAKNPRHPKTMVSWDDCTAWSQKVGFRLPTEWEWETAARGDDGRDYPWGNQEPNDELLCWSGGEIQRSGPEDVGSHPKGASPFGLYDMSGLAWQWTATEWSEKPKYPKVRNPWDFGPRVVRIPLRVGDEVTHEEIAKTADAAAAE